MQWWIIWAVLTGVSLLPILPWRPLAPLMTMGGSSKRGSWPSWMP